MSPESHPAGSDAGQAARAVYRGRGARSGGGLHTIFFLCNHALLSPLLWSSWSCEVASGSRHALVGGSAITRCARADISPILRLVRVWIDLPDAIVEQLAEKGQDLSRAALEAVAIDAYRMDRITAYQLCQLLEIPSRYELDGFLKHHGVPLEYTLGDFEREGATSARLWRKRQEELATDRDRERPAE